MSSLHTSSVTGILILYDKPWESYKRTLDLVIRNPRLRKIIISTNKKENLERLYIFTKMYAGKVILLEKETDSSSLLLAEAVTYAKEQSTDYVFFLDHDTLPDEKLFEDFFDNLKYFSNKDTSKIIMVGNTIDVFGEERSFYKSTSKAHFKDGTLFEILTVKKIIHILRNYIRKSDNTPTTKPVIRTQAFIGGGTLVPMQAIKENNAPHSSLYKFGEDIEYAWRIKESGYSFFQCSTPIIRRPSDEKTGEHHVFGLFSKNTSTQDVFYHIRNAVIISRKHTYQSKITLFLNIVAWVLASCILGIFKTSSLSLFFVRTRTIIRAVKKGYTENII